MKMPIQKTVKLFCGLLFVLSTFAMCSSSGKYWMYVGTYTGKGSQGIYAYRFNPSTGEAIPAGLAAETENPSILAVDPTGHYLYAVNEVDKFQGQPTGGVSVFAIDPASGKLKFLQEVASRGAGPAHLAFDKSGTYLLVANYSGDNVAVFPVSGDGNLGAASAFVQHSGASVNLARQSAPHPHEIQPSPDNRFVLVADLGLDQLLVYRFDANQGTFVSDMRTAGYLGKL